jgi:hypothetical protein
MLYDVISLVETIDIFVGQLWMNEWTLNQGP